MTEWQEALEQLHDYSEQVANQVFTSTEESEEGAALLQGVENFIGQVNTDHRQALDDQIGALESFLGI